MFWIIAIAAIIVFIVGFILVKKTQGKIGFIGNKRKQKDADLLLAKKDARTTGLINRKKAKFETKIDKKAAKKPWKYTEEGQKLSGRAKRKERRRYKKELKTSRA